MGSPQYIETLEVVNAIGERCSNHELSQEQFTAEITNAFYGYLADEDPRDDVVGLVDYCVQLARQVCDITLFADRVLPVRLDHQLRWILEQQADGQSLLALVQSLRTRLQTADETAKIELIELCRNGYETYQSLFSAVDAERDILCLAHEHGVVAALDAAVRPTAAGRLANEDKSKGLALPRTLDLIAHIASDPTHPNGTLARDSLVDLCGYDETVGPAALRLPVHLLSADQRDRLRRIYVEHDDALGTDSADIFITEQQLRDREILRSALWQANDADRMFPIR